MSKKTSCRNQQNRGSFIVAAGFFMILIMAVVAFGMDLSRYFLIRQHVQQIADGAALAGAEALEQPRDVPDIRLARDAILKHIKDTQGKGHMDLYETKSPGYGKGYIIHPKNPPGPVCGEDYFPTATSGCESYPEGTYWVGVLAFGKFNPIFLSDVIFGEEIYRIVQPSIAQIVPKQIQGQGPISLDCGVYADQSITVDGNNLNASGTNFCSNGPFDGSGSNNGISGDLVTLKGQPVLPMGNGYGEIKHFDDPKTVPSFLSPPSDDYTADLTDFAAWATDPGCPTPGAGESIKPLQTDTGVLLKWSNTGNPVCVTKTTSTSTYKIEENNQGHIQTTGGNPVSIYADGNVNFDGNTMGIDGGLYATGNIVIDGNTHEYFGDVDTLGGLALWAGGDLTFEQNNVHLRGILGSGGDFQFGTRGGGTGGPQLDGVIMTGGKLTLPPNTANSRITYDPSTFDHSFVDSSGWTTIGYTQIIGEHLYANAEVSLIH